MGFQGEGFQGETTIRHENVFGFAVQDFEQYLDKRIHASDTKYP